MIEIKGKYSLAKVFSDDIDETTYSQIIQVVNHPSFINPVRIMPDTHAGAANSVIGFTMKIGKTIIPNTVGVDIGCGMISTKLETKVSNLNFKDIDINIRKIIPIGNKKGVNKKAIINFEKKFPYEIANKLLWNFTKNFNEEYNTNFTPIEYNYDWFENLCKRIGAKIYYIEQSLGSLGGGNHFIEIGESSADNSIWLTVHTGSRQLGKKIADYHSKKAKENFKFDKKSFNKELKEAKESLKQQGKELQIPKFRAELYRKYLPKEIDFPANMVYLKGEDMYKYFIDMIFAQVFASENRKMIIEQISKKLKINILEQIESIHNYIDFEDFIIRKGAISAYENEKIIIPFNMADGILICQGKSNADWNFSAPHGAGRVLSRRKAKENLSLKEFQKMMKNRNIYTTSVSHSTLDEAPKAYKNANEIEKNIGPTAKILYRLKPLYNLKG